MCVCAGVNGKVVEFAALARLYLGPWGSWLCMIASVGVLWGASLAYCILMSGFLFNVADTIAYWGNGIGTHTAGWPGRGHGSRRGGNDREIERECVSVCVCVCVCVCACACVCVCVCVCVCHSPWEAARVALSA
jgi:hypothetical protein